MLQNAEFDLYQITTYRTKGYGEDAHEDIEGKSQSEVEAKQVDSWCSGQTLPQLL